MSRKNRRLSLAVALILLMSLVLAACGSPEEAAETAVDAGEDIATEVAPQPDAEPTPTAPGAGEGTPAPAPDVAVTPGENFDFEITPAAGQTPATEGVAGVGNCPDTGETLRIFASLPLTGISRGQTVSVVNGMTLALEQADGRAGGYEVEFEALDDATAAAGQWTAEAETANAQRAINENATVYLGTFNSGAAAVSIPILNRAGIPMISPANTAINLTLDGPPDPALFRTMYQAGPRNYFRVVPNDRIQGAAAANFAANDLGVSNVYVLHDNEVYGRGLAQVFRNTAEDLGLEVLGFEAINPDAGNFQSVMQKVVNSGAEMVYFGGLSDTGGPALVRDLRAIAGPDEVAFMGADGILESGFIEAAGAENAADAYGTVAATPPDQLQGRGRQFYQDYRARFNADPEPYAIFGYDSMGVALQAINQACSNDPAQVLDALNNLGEYQGAIGNFTFDENGDTTFAGMNVYQVRDGEWTWVQGVSAPNQE